MPSMLITGGAGFIGVNSARYLTEKGWRLTLLDNLSRQGSEDNLSWIRDRSSIDFEQADVRDRAQMERVLRQTRPDVVLHLAGQVAVTRSVEDPRRDFELNALGTLNALEAVRLHSPDAFFINASTNKVYGEMKNLGIVEHERRYEYQDLPKGVPESQPLDFHSPYGCSKGAADQYTIDYARIYGLDTVNFRQSCIYGTQQFGIEDQGWVAWLTIAAVLAKPITLYGNGKQVRDLLYVDDLSRAYEAAIENREKARGQSFNVGGGPENTLSLLQLIAYLEELTGSKIEILKGKPRPGDQPIYVSDLTQTRKVLDWRPEVDIEEGIRRLIRWVKENERLFAYLG